NNLSQKKRLEHFLRSIHLIHHLYTLPHDHYHKLDKYHYLHKDPHKMHYTSLILVYTLRYLEPYGHRFYDSLSHNQLLPFAEYIRKKKGKTRGHLYQYEFSSKSHLIFSLTFSYSH